MRVKNPDFPLVYSCSGCSSAAQTANYAALQLDRRGVAEMSCIAGIGGDVPQLLKIAKSGRPIIALDGCPLACTRSTLARHDLHPDHYHQLNEYGVKKRVHVDFDREQGDAVVERVIAALESDRVTDSPVAPD
ncbi:putative zinc-binding protein [Noviherbaspirillum agri]